MKIEFSYNQIVMLIDAAQQKLDQVREDGIKFRSELDAEIAKYESLSWFKRLYTSDPNERWWEMNHYICRRDFAKGLLETFVSIKDTKCEVIELTRDEYEFLFGDN